MPYKEYQYWIDVQKIMALFSQKNISINEGLQIKQIIYYNDLLKIDRIISRESVEKF
jgi:hypothetical protein